MLEAVKAAPGARLISLVSESKKPFDSEAQPVSATPMVRAQQNQIVRKVEVTFSVYHAQKWWAPSR